MKFVFVIWFSLTLLLNLTGQTVVRGKISDTTGETLVGVAVYLKNNTTVGVTTDLDGNFSLTLKDNKPQVVIVSYVSYKTIEDTLIFNKPLLIKNYVMEPVISAIKEVVVYGSIKRGSDASLEAIKKISATTVDFISAETIKKTGDVNVSSAIARVSGVSNTSNGLITVRGAGDRYIKTTINGSRIPTLDPFTNNIKLDIFPSSLIDNITITKTARPDIAGDWAGAYISVDTKQYPDSLQVSVETSFGYNDQTTFKEVTSSYRSSTDWLGFDNGFRDYDHDKFVEFFPEPTAYQEFVALGLGDYFQSLGITSIKHDDETTKRLGLIELGLLGKAHLNDPIAVDAAWAKFNTPEYKGKAYSVINADAIEAAKIFPNNWSGTKRKAPLNFSQSFSIGNQTQLLGKPFGYLLGFRYSSSTQYDPNSRANKLIPESNDPLEMPYDSTFQKASRVTNGWSGLINLAYKFNPFNTISLMFMPNVIGVNNARDAKIYVGNEPITPEENLKRTGNSIYQYYESRKQMVYQIKSGNYIPSLRMKIDLNASYTKGTSIAPDFKNANYPPTTASVTNRPYFVGQSNAGAGRIYRYLNENIFDSNISAEIPLSNQPELLRKIKFGGAYQNIYRERDQFFYQLYSGNGDYSGVTPNMAAHPTADPYGLDRFEIDPVVVDPKYGHQIVQQFYGLYDYPSSHIFGKSDLISGFIMLDYTLFPMLRASGGLRVEQTYMYTDCNQFDAYQLAANDERRRFTGEGLSGTLFVQPGKLNTTSYLPSANIILKLKQDERFPVNVRLNYSQTVARPSLQELSDIAFYDYELRNYVRGNSGLKMVSINNFDFRFESYFKSNDNISVSLFYKDFKNHIELVNAGPTVGFCFTNNESNTTLQGIELEGKKQLTTTLDFVANITLVKSKSTPSNITFDPLTGEQQNDSGTSPGRTVTMFGQAPYIINATLAYDSKKSGVYGSINYNVQGPRLVSIGFYPLPDIYEMPRNLVDFKIGTTIGKHFGASLKINDVLASLKYGALEDINTDIVRAYKVGDNYPVDFDRYSFGTYYVFAISYKL
jgi:hypothetical protein